VALAPLGLGVMRKIVAIVVLVLSALACDAYAASATITRQKATHIALVAAGCKKSNDCVVHGNFQNGKWVFVVSYVRHDSRGRPIIIPGDWIGVSISPEGQVLEKVPGA